MQPATSWQPDEIATRLRDLAAGIGATLEVTLVFVLVRALRDGRDTWLPAIGRVDFARQGEAAFEPPQDYGEARLLTERIDLATFLYRIDSAVGDGVLVCQGSEVVHQFGSGTWTYDRVPTHVARRHGVSWPCHVVTRHFAEHPPQPLGILESATGVVASIHDLVALHCGFTEYAGADDGRYGRIQFFVWDYRGRIRRAWISSTELVATVEPVPSDLRLRAALDGYSFALPVTSAELRHDTRGHVTGRVELARGGEIFDATHVSREDPPTLPDGIPLPEGDAAALLRSLDVVTPMQRVRGLHTLHECLMKHRRRRVSDSQLRRALAELVELGFVTPAENPGPRIRSVGDLEDLGIRAIPAIYAPGDPRPGEECFAATSLGAKAAQLLAAKDAPFMKHPVALGRERALDQAVYACWLPREALELDALLASLTTEEVRQALERATQVGLIQESHGRFELSSNGKGRYAELEREWTAKLTQEVAAQPVVRLPRTDALAVSTPTFVRDPKLRAIIERDLRELRANVEQGRPKSSLLLLGSIVEALFVDIFGRNSALVTAGKKKPGTWLDDASLPELVRTACGLQVLLPDGSTKTLLTPTAGATANSVADHRDLIHPRAEIRTGIQVDATTVEALIYLFKLVVRDFEAAAADGRLDAFEKGSVPP